MKTVLNTQNENFVSRTGTISEAVTVISLVVGSKTKPD